MNFTIQTKELLRSINACSKVIQSKNTLAILDNVLISKKDDVYTLTGASVDQRYETELSSFTLTEGEFSSVCLPYKPLQASLSTIDDELLLVTVDGFTITFHYEGGKFNLQCLNADEYPVAPSLSNDVTMFQVPSEIFLDVVKCANNFTANDILRPTMTGVCIDAQADSLVVVGSDGHRLYKYTMPEIGAGYLKGTPSSFVVPRNLVSALDNLRTSETISVSTDGTQITFSTDSARIIARMIEGRYPNYNSVIPENYPTTFTVSAKAFSQSIKRVSVFGNDNSKLLVLSVKDNDITLSATDIECSTNSEEKLPVIEHNLKSGMKIGLNYAHLLTVLANIPTENVNVYVKDDTKAVKFKGDVLKNDPTVIIQMPMLIS